MQANDHDRLLERLAADVLSGRCHEAPWDDLSRKYFRASEPNESWELFCKWARDNNISWSLDARRVIRERMWVTFMLRPVRQLPPVFRFNFAWQQAV